MNTSSGGGASISPTLSGTGSLFCIVFKSRLERQSLGRHETITRARSRWLSISLESRPSARSSLPEVSFSSPTASRKNQPGALPSAFHASNFFSAGRERRPVNGSRSGDSSGTQKANWPSPAKRSACSTISVVLPAPASARRTTRACSRSAVQPMLEPSPSPIQGSESLGVFEFAMLEFRVCPVAKSPVEVDESDHGHRSGPSCGDLVNGPE